MTRILHLSDLHFGFHRAALVEPLLALVNRLAADLVAVTGDVTHRGRPGQFDQAAAFLSRIGAPVMVVPGNHDLPLYDMPLRFLLPFAGYRRVIGPDLTPTRQAGGVRVIGMNSADPFAWQRGVIRRGEIGRVAGGLDPLAVNLVALHHPLEHLAQVDKALARRAPEALARFVAAGVRIVLSGHLHVWTTDAMRAETAHPGVLQVQAGTALCARITDRQNEFALLDIDGPDVRIARHVAPMDRDDFGPPLHEHYILADGVWTRRHQPGETPILPGATDTAFSTA